MEYCELYRFYKNKKILVTGHTGFKGSWLCEILKQIGADVTGYSLNPEELGLYKLLNLKKSIDSVYGDIRDLEHLQFILTTKKPEIVIHLAAQPIVRESYENPVYTYETNVMGTVNILEAIRKSESVKSFLNVTTDKVYENREWCWGYRENDRLDGYDPYSNSKSCSELVTHSYSQSFLNEKGVMVSTARAGNVIGGGDFAKDRIIPDCARAASQKEEIKVRNPYSIRPFQHVLEPLFAYLIIAMKQYQDGSHSGNYNIGPDEKDCIQTGKLVDLFCLKWGEGQNWKNVQNEGPHEAGFLKLDCSKIKSSLGWKPAWNIEKAVEKTIDWYKTYYQGGNIETLMEKQIQEYIDDFFRG